MPTQAELRKQDEEEREKTAQESRKELRVLFAGINREGIKRLRAIPDKVWDTAVAEGISAP